MSDSKLVRPASPIMDPALTDAGLHLADPTSDSGLRQVLAAASNDNMEWAPSHLQGHGHPGALRSDLDPDSEDNPNNSNNVTATTRRNANGSVSSVFSGNRITCLKKEDGQPFWRKDIQFLFLRHVFEDESRVFTKASEGTNGHTFSEIYIDAMAKSSKCSQILKEKLLTDKASAVDMAMICLLVNVGRMNTTLNFFPEMRARVRTYHAIPCLQAQQGSNAYKQLQDGPRLKSILKGAMEDTQQPSNIDDLLSAPKPRTNPVNLIFVLSQYAPRVSETHFFPPRDFFDLFMRPNISSRSRATAFLWLMWWYLESDFSINAAEENPFGPGIRASEAEAPIKVPALDIISDEQADAENMDTELEIEYGESKRLERESIVANDIPATSTSKKSLKNPLIEQSQQQQQQQQHNYRFRYSPYGSSASDSGGSRGRGSPSPTRETRMEPHSGHQKRPRRFDGDRTWSHSPQTATPRRSNPRAPSKFEALLNEDDSSSSHPAGQSQGSRRRGVGGRSRRQGEYSPRPLLSNENLAIADTGHGNIEGHGSMSQQTPGSAGYSKSLAPAPRNGSPDPPARSAMSGSGRTRQRPQLTVEQSRRERINYTLYHRMQELRQYKSRERRKRGAIVDSWYKCKLLDQGYDSEEDESNRWAGVDSIPLVRSDRLAERRDEPLDAGDAGAAAKKLAKSFNRLAWVMDGVKVPRPSGSLRRPDRAAAAGSGAQQGTDALLGRALAPAPPTESGVAFAKKRIGTKRPSGRARGGNADVSSVAGDDNASNAGGSIRKRKRPSSSRKTIDLGGMGELTPKSTSGSGRKRARKHLGDLERESLATDDDGGSIAMSDDEIMDDAPTVKHEGPGPSNLRDEWGAARSPEAAS